MLESKDNIIVGQDDASDDLTSIIKAIEFVAEDKSRQITTDLFEGKYESLGAVEPPYNPNIWGSLIELSTRLKRSIDILSQNTVGIGYEFCHKYHEEDAAQISRDRIFRKEKRKLAPLFELPNPYMSFNEILVHVKQDEEATGDGYLEVVRDSEDKIIQLYHVPSYTIRVLKIRDGEKVSRGFVQTRGSARIYFKNFGDRRSMDYTNGEFSSRISLDKQASELIHFKLYSPRSSFYGIPRYVSASPSITGRRFSALRDMNFFENDATPRVIITISGGRVDGESVKRIKDFLTQAKGVKNTGRILLLQSEEKKSIVDRENKATIAITPLTVGVTDDASFLKYKEFCDTEVREAFGISKVFYGTSEDVNRSGAVVSRTSTINQIFLPELLRYEYRINNTIVRDFGVSRVRLKLQRPKVTDLQQDAEIIHRFSLTGGIAPDDVRKFLDYDGYGKPWAKLPLQILTALIQNGHLKLSLDSEGNYTLVAPYISELSKSFNGSEPFISSDDRESEKDNMDELDTVN